MNQDYDKIVFRISDDKSTFYIDYYGGKNPINIKYNIVDYYSDNCIYSGEILKMFNSGIWIVPNNLIHRDYLIKNGYYLEVRDLNNNIVCINYLDVENLELKDPLFQIYNNLRIDTFSSNEVKFLEYVHFYKMFFYKKFNLQNKNIKTFIDAGANYGMFALSLISMGAKEGILIEADQDVAKTLKKNIILENIKILDQALFDKDDFIDFYQFESTVNGNIMKNLTNNDNIKQIIKVPTVNVNTLLDKYFNNKIVDLFKIDIEGAEYKVFEKITQDNIEKCKSFIIEFHMNFNHEINQIINKLSKYNYSFQFDKFDQNAPDDILNNHMGVIYAYKN